MNTKMQILEFVPFDFLTQKMQLAYPVAHPSNYLRTQND